jgi:hypothetical protein
MSSTASKEPVGVVLAKPFIPVRTITLQNLFRRSDNRICPFITRKTCEGLYGYIEDIGPTGIRGWLMDGAACDTHLKVDAYLDGHFLGSGHAVRHRPDVSRIMGRPIHCEFLAAYDPTTLLKVLSGLEPTRKKHIRVVAAESGREIVAAEDGYQTVGQLLAYATTAAALLPQEPSR